jgi:hypothetical protein
MSSVATLNGVRLEPSEAIQRATGCLAELSRKVSSVTGISRTAEGWRVTVELVERAAIPDTMDLLGVYEVLLGPEGELTGYERIRMRRRCDLEERV